MSQLYSNVTEAGDNAVNCRIVQHFTGGQKCKLLSRSSLFIKPNGDQTGALLSAYGDEATHSVRIKCDSQCVPLYCSLCCIHCGIKVLTNISKGAKCLQNFEMALTKTLVLYQTVQSYCLSRDCNEPPKMLPLKTTLETYFGMKITFTE